MHDPYRVLFVCTGNSARSIMAEAILNARGQPSFAAYSAGSRPLGRVRPEAIAQLQTAKIPTHGLRSKSWDEFLLPEAPRIDAVITVCDNAAREECPLFPALRHDDGLLLKAHWGLPDPAAVRGSLSAIQNAYREAFEVLERRIARLIAISPDHFGGNGQLEAELARIGRSS